MAACTKALRQQLVLWSSRKITELGAKVPNLNEYLNRSEYKGNKITNFEMETSALYGLCALLGHEAGTVCAIIANRFSKSYSKDYKKTVDKLIELTLHRLTQ